MKAARRGCGSESSARQGLNSKGESVLISIFRRQIINAIRHASLTALRLKELLDFRDFFLIRRLGPPMRPALRTIISQDARLSSQFCVEVALPLPF